MSDDKWINVAHRKPNLGDLCEVIYADGYQCRASYAGGPIWYPEGSSVYRYTDVMLWRPIEEEAREASA